MRRLSPYFKMLAREDRICPKCLKGRLRVAPAGLSPNVAMDRCECGYMQVRVAPESMQVEEPAPGGVYGRLADELNARRSARPARVTGREGNIIRVDFAARRAGA